DEGRVILASYRSHAWAMLGYASFSEYIDHFLGHSPRQTHERLRVAEALERLPLLAHALESGELCWSVVREVSRVATSQTEREWIELARGKRAGVVEKLVSGHRRGDRPNDPPSEDARKYVLRFEVAAETKALFREALEKIRRDAGGGFTRPP